MASRRLHYLNISEVQRLQRHLGLTDEQLAVRAGISVVTLNKWMKGGAAFISKIKKLADALSVPPDTIRVSEVPLSVGKLDNTPNYGINQVTLEESDGWNSKIRINFSIEIDIPIDGTIPPQIEKIRQYFLDSLPEKFNPYTQSPAASIVSFTANSATILVCEFSTNVYEIPEIMQQIKFIRF